MHNISSVIEWFLIGWVKKLLNVNEIIVAIRIKEKNFPLIQKELFVLNTHKPQVSEN